MSQINTDKINVNYYKSINDPQVAYAKSINNFLPSICYSEHSEKIIKSRKGELDYDLTKANLPCITYNFLYDGYKNDSHIIKGTGLLCIEIDDDSFNIKLIDKNKVLAYYKPYCGKGYFIIVRVDGLTLCNFKSTYYSIAENLGISAFIDENTMKASEYSVLSYDESIYINLNPLVYIASDEKVSSTLIGSNDSQDYHNNDVFIIPQDVDNPAVFIDKYEIFLSPHDINNNAGFIDYNSIDYNDKLLFPQDLNNNAGYINNSNINNVLEAPQGFSPLSPPSSTTFNYVTNNTEYITNELIPVYTGCTEEISTINDDEFYAQNAGFFNNPSILYIPKKVEYALKKYMSKNLLREIDADESIAIEKCLIFLNNLSLTFYTEDKWKPLHSTILDTQLQKENDNTYMYAKVAKALKIGTKQKGAIIEVKTNEDDIESYQQKVISKQYKISDTYLKAGLIQYKLQTPYLINRRRKEFFRNLKEAHSNVIANNLLQLYASIDLPTKQEILNHGKVLAKNKAETKKHKIITVRNKQSNSAWKDVSKRTFVEDNIDLFSYLTDNGFYIPDPGKEKSGGRVVDSFNLMPSWIRKMIKINGEEIVEVDCKALHPNLNIKIYGGNEKYITHQKVAEKANIDIMDVKEEHLSFFNKHHWQMKESPLWDYYIKNEPLMMKNLIDDKYKNGYKITSKKLFKLEVEIMTEVIKRLNENGLYVGYVYDALFCKKSEAFIVKDMMDLVLKEFGIFTTASFVGMNEVIDLKAIPIEAENPKKIAMREKFNQLFRYFPDSTLMTPAQLHTLTSNVFYHLKFDLILKAIKNVRENNFELFWKNIQDLKKYL